MMMRGLHLLASGMLWLGGGVLVTIAALLAGPAVESTYFPVVRYTTVEITGRSADHVDIEITGIKLRGCRLREFTTLIRDLTSVWRYAEVRIDKEPMRMRSRALGWQSFGVWEVVPTGDRVKFMAWHECHSL